MRTEQGCRGVGRRGAAAAKQAESRLPLAAVQALASNRPATCACSNIKCQPQLRAAHSMCRHSVRSAPGVLHPHGALLAVELARLCGSGGKHQNRRNELSKMQGRQGTTCGSNTEGMPARPLDRCKRSRNLMHQCSTHPHQSRRWSPLSQTRAAGRRRPSPARPCRTGSASTVARPAT